MNRGLFPSVKAKILELKRQGFSMNQIAKELKLTKGQVAGELYRARQRALARGLVDDKRSDSR